MGETNERCADARDFARFLRPRRAAVCSSRERERKKKKKKREEWMNVKLFLSVLKGARARVIIIAF